MLSSWSIFLRPASPQLSRLVALAALLASPFLHAQNATTTPAQPVASPTQPASAPAAPAAMPAAPAETVPPANSAAFGQSLALRTDRAVVDSSHTALGWLAQTSPVPYSSTGALRLRLTLYPAAGNEMKLVKDLGQFPVWGNNLAANPFPFALNLRDVPDGNYQYVAEVWDGEVSLAKFQKPVTLVAGLDARQAALESRLAKVAGHDSTKATILYPFDLARVINLGKRIPGVQGENPEFGRPEGGDPAFKPFDYAAAMKNSEQLLTALESGQDPLWQAKGDLNRHYYMTESDEILPYRVYVPTTWDGKSQLPLVFVLHGNTRDQDFYFERSEHLLTKLAEKFGFLLAGPLGYYPNGGYNYVAYGRGGNAPRGLAGATASAQTYGPAGPGRGRGAANTTGWNGVNGSVTPQTVRAEWSEQDAMHVFDLIKKEYPVDPKRTFLYGYSAGGQGAHYFGPKYAENWAAIALGGSNTGPSDAYPYDRLKTIPVMILYGMEDSAGVRTNSGAMVPAMQQHGVDAVLKEYPGATHDTAPAASFADVLQFFADHPRK